IGAAHNIVVEHGFHLLPRGGGRACKQFAVAGKPFDMTCRLTKIADPEQETVLAVGDDSIGHPGDPRYNSRATLAHRLDEREAEPLEARRHDQNVMLAYPPRNIGRRNPARKADLVAKRRKTVAQFRQIGTVTGDCQMVGAIELAQYVRQPENALGVVLDTPEIKQAQRTAFILFGAIARQMNAPVQS